MTLTNSWQPTGLPLLLFATGLASLAVSNTLESLPWISLRWVLQEPLLHMWETYHSSLIYPLKTTIFMALYPTSWLLCVDCKLSALDRTPFLECYHHGFGSSLSFESCMLIATGSMYYPSNSMHHIVTANNSSQTKHAFRFDALHYLPLFILIYFIIISTTLLYIFYSIENILCIGYIHHFLCT